MSETANPTAGGGHQQIAADHADQPGQARDGGKAVADPAAGRSLPERAFWPAVIVGLLLIVFGASLALSAQTAPIYPLCMCIGFGIILAAFGTSATARSNIPGAPVWAMTGAGATAIILFVLFVQLSPLPVRPLTKKIVIGGDIEPVAYMTMLDAEPLFARKDKKTRFVYAVEGGFSESNVQLIVERVKRKDDGSEQFIMIAKRDKLNDILRKEANPFWLLNFGDEKVVDPAGGIIFEPQVRFTPPSDKVGLNFSPIGRAFAGESQGSVQGQAPGTAEITQYIDWLRSDDATLRRRSRDALASLGPRVVPLLMSSLAEHRQDYRTKLGTCFVLSRMLRENPATAQEISERLSDEDIRRLSSLIQDHDKSIQLYATEALYRLNDKRAVDPTFALAKKAKDPDTQYNLFTVLGRSLSKAAPATRRSVGGEALKYISPQEERTRALFETFQR